MLVEDRECWAVFCVDFADAGREDHLDIREVSEDDADWPETDVRIGGPCLIELFVGELEDAGVDGFDSDAHASDELIGGELLECFDRGGGGV